MPQRFPRPAGLVLALALLALPLLVVAPARAQEAEGQPVQVEPPSVTVAPVRREEIAARAVVSGTLVAREEVQIYPRVSGQEIVELFADAGDRVEKDAPLARLDSSTLKAQVDQAKASLASAEAGIAQAEGQVSSAEANRKQAQQALERTRTLNRRGDAAQATLDQATATADSAEAALRSAEAALSAAKAQKQQAEAALEVAQLNLDWAEIRSPVAGVVLSRNATLGALTGAAGEPLFLIAANGEVEVEAEVIETDLARIDPGDPAVIDVAGRAPLTGEVRQVSPLVDPQTRLGSVRIAIRDLDTVRTGLFARAVITTDVRQALVVPASAVLSDGGARYVQLVKDGTVEQRTVETGALSEGRREILDGLSEGEQVILRAGAFFRQGDRVKPVTEEAAPVPSARQGGGETAIPEAGTDAAAGEKAEAEAQEAPPAGAAQAGE